MKSLLDSFHLVITRKDSRLVIIVSTIIFLLLLLVAQNGEGSMEMLSLTSIPFIKRLGLAFLVFFDIKSTFTAGTLF
jgi:hypothetical protein